MFGYTIGIVVPRQYCIGTTDKGGGRGRCLTLGTVLALW